MFLVLLEMVNNTLVLLEMGQNCPDLNDTNGLSAFLTHF